MDETLAQAMRRIPQLRDVDPSTVVAERLGGLTNLVYHVNAAGADYVLRIPGAGTEAYIDRVVELHNAAVAAGAGVSAEVLFGAPDGLMLTRYLPGTTTMNPELFQRSEGAPARAARALKQLHGCKQAFRFRFELFAMIDDYLGHLDRLGAPLPDGYQEAVGEAEQVRRVLDRYPGELAPCHCDPLCENFLDKGERMWIVDWEYSGMNDPFWDLGDLSVEAGFDSSRDEEMMLAWCGAEPSGDQFGRMVIYKAMCDLLWTLWGLIQHANQNPVEDFWAYSLARFERCMALMGQSDFHRHLGAIGRG